MGLPQYNILLIFIISHKMLEDGPELLLKYGKLITMDAITCMDMGHLLYLWPQGITKSIYVVGDQRENGMIDLLVQILSFKIQE